MNGRLDYINNDGLLQDTSHLLLGIDLYVGGLSTELLSTLPSSVSTCKQVVAEADYLINNFHFTTRFM